jgi:hypothetical protein
MIKNLWFASSFFLILGSCSNFICKNSQTENIAGGNAQPFFTDTVNVIKFKSRIIYKTSDISGILILKKMNETTLTGGLINEFGIKGFDFSITENHARLGYVYKNIDKWYIRRILETDLHFLFSKPVYQSKCSINDTSVYITTISPSLHYVYYTVNGKNPERADMYKGAHKIASLRQYMNEQSEVVLEMKYTDSSLSYSFCEMKN